MILRQEEAHIKQKSTIFKKLSITNWTLLLYSKLQERSTFIHRSSFKILGFKFIKQEL